MRELIGIPAYQVEYVSWNIAKLQMKAIVRKKIKDLEHAEHK